MTTETADAGAGTTESQVTQDNAAPEQAQQTAENTAPEGKTDGATKPEDASAKDDSKAGDDAPLVYDFKAPEGMELDTAAVDQFKGLAAELKLAPESAQKVVDLYAGIKQAEAQAFADQVKAGGDEGKADKEIGGKNLDVTLASARKVIDTFGGDGVKSLLDSTGMGNHPDVVRMLAKIGKAISEDTMERGMSGEGAPRDAASVLYGTTTN